jgi:hypothetical protein
VLSSIVGSDCAIEISGLTLFPPGRGTQLLRSFALLSGSLLLAAPTHIVGQADPSRISGSAEQVYLIIRSDDAGMSHSVNMGLERLIAPELGALKAHNVRLLTYRQLIAIQGLQSTHRTRG